MWKFGVGRCKSSYEAETESGINITEIMVERLGFACEKRTSKPQNLFGLDSIHEMICNFLYTIYNFLAMFIYDESIVTLVVCNFP